MKKLLTIVTLSTLAVVSQAQQLGSSLLYDIRTKTWTPVASVKLFGLDDFLGQKKFTAEVRMLGGIEHDRGLAATALVVSYPIAKQLSLELGGAVRILADRSPAFGIVIGASFKF